MRNTLLVAIALASLAMPAGPLGPGLSFATDAPAPAASQDAQKYVLAVAGMT